MIRVRTERCDTCIFRVKYPPETRERVLGGAAREDTFVQCHKHDPEAHVVCGGYYKAIGEAGCTVVQIAIRLERAGRRVVEWVEDGGYPPLDEED